MTKTFQLTSLAIISAAIVSSITFTPQPVHSNRPAPDLRPIIKTAVNNSAVIQKSSTRKTIQAARVTKQSGKTVKQTAATPKKRNVQTITTSKQRRGAVASIKRKRLRNTIATAKRKHNRRAAAIAKVPAIKMFPKAKRLAIQQRFAKGQAGLYSPADLLRASVFSYYPLIGGTFTRQSEIQNIIVHSTETARVASAKAIVRSWNNSGRMHAGTQYIIDRDGIIYQTVDPSKGTFHVNSYRTLHNVKNDNSIGIEIVRTGNQEYTAAQMKSVIGLVHYLKDHFHVAQVWGHGQIQPSTRTDPVSFDWTAFNKGLDSLQTSEIASQKAHPAG